MKVISVVGLGYVGLPFSIFLAENGYKVIGIDTNTYKINALKKGKAYLSEPGIQEGLKNIEVDLFLRHLI